MQWAESLRPWEKEFINDALADARATIETEIVSNIDTIITAALVEKTDLSLKEIFDINVTVGEFYGRIRYENSIKGFDYLIVLITSKELLSLRKDEFINQVLRRFNPKKIVCGFDYSFGHFGKGKPKDLISCGFFNVYLIIHWNEGFE